MVREEICGGGGGFLHTNLLNFGELEQIKRWPKKRTASEGQNEKSYIVPPQSVGGGTAAGLGKIEDKRESMCGRKGWNGQITRGPKKNHAAVLEGGGRMIREKAKGKKKRGKKVGGEKHNKGGSRQSTFTGRTFKFAIKTGGGWERSWGRRQVPTGKRKRGPKEDCRGLWMTLGLAAFTKKFIVHDREKRGKALKERKRKPTKKSQIQRPKKRFWRNLLGKGW